MFVQIAHRLSVAAAVSATVLALATPVVARESVRPGLPAPDFSVPDSSGTPVSLSRFKGKTVVLEWTNHECPYVGKHYGTGTMQKLQKDAKADGVAWLTVISSAPGQQGHVAGLEADNLSAVRKAEPTAVLLDDDGKVGRLYGASTTPHMFVIDKTGIVAYMGAIDDKPTTSRNSVTTARPYVRDALVALREGKAVAAPTSTRPYGCSIKYTN
jgi:peroxiredoxin